MVRVLEVFEDFGLTVLELSLVAVGFEAESEKILWFWRSKWHFICPRNNKRTNVVFTLKSANENYNCGYRSKGI